MSDIIKLLPDSVANQIAAGEVIQRPASVIKELVENAVDAGATDIKVYIKDAGRTLIQVVDNGKGMSDTDARMAFERHATSKISGADDLFTLRTMGFRGEALPSICAISQVEVKTRTPENSMGTHLLINASRVEMQEPCLCDQGTNIMVKNIFFNVPARRKFLKSDNVELSNILREFERLALVNNNIRMSIDTGTRVIDLRAATFKQRIGDIWKNNLDLHLLPIEVETSLIKISGYISRPEFARRRNPLQYLIVNGRNMRHPYFHKAIMNCYDPLIASDTQPCYFLKFTVDPATIDVNIHPTKNEIKFEYEQEIWPILQASVKAALGKYGAVPSIDFNSDVLPVEPLHPGEMPEKPGLDIPSDYNPFKMEGSQSAWGGGDVSGWNVHNDPAKNTQSAGGYGGGKYPGNSFRQDRPQSNWEKLYSEFINGARGFNGNVDSGNAPEKEESGKLFAEEDMDSSVGTFCVQHAMRYIITSSRDGIIIVDQHRAHVKVLYERYVKQLSEGKQLSENLMFEETISLDPEQQEAFAEAAPELMRIGFALEYDEGNRWRISSVPAILKNVEPKDVVLKMLDSISDGSANYGKDGDTPAELLKRLALVMARSAAIQRGTKLSADEMEHLIGELFSLPDPAYTPNGSLVFHVIDSRKLDSIFR